MLTCPRCGYYNSDISSRCEQCDARLTVANTERPRHSVEATPAPTPEAPPTSPKREPEYGGFWVRFLAATIDGFVLSVGVLLLDGFIPIVSLLALFLIPALYEIIMEAQSGATLGKRVFGLRVVTADTLQPISVRRSIGRHLGHYVSAFFLLGYIMAGLNRRKRALHDYMAGTVVIKECRP